MWVCGCGCVGVGVGSQLREPHLLVVGLLVAGDGPTQTKHSGGFYYQYSHSNPKTYTQTHSKETRCTLTFSRTYVSFFC